MLSYQGVNATLLTKHEKASALQPALRDSLDITLEEYSQFDTDRLGTFTGSVSRLSDQIGTAQYKAELATKLGNHPIGLGSEGSFNSDSGLGILNTEVLVWFDSNRSLTITAIANQWLMAEANILCQWRQMREYAERCDFPEQGLILRPNHGQAESVYLDASDLAQLEQQFRHCLSISQQSKVWVEFDFRAHRCPKRQSTLSLAAEDLCRRLSQSCPTCYLPGFGLYKAEPGRACSNCGSPTTQVGVRIYQCPHCDYQQQQSIEQYADPFYCGYCNP
ncbi:hypothetical protein HMF8227_03003 [Saliniradius amylolyticus]|uniref:DUF6671 domain-containing protein n=1 Tax=Saliniradius amylolyticus TaxID=2183582 RepID=A0A2S2E723_9ALTE|nr:DUF6671 family protein [Saliniradius amylolyticus]AWL13451.1 hypothetical protein HMF8227_03003 [Saliniradius amylolyticus]